MKLSKCNNRDRKIERRRLNKRRTVYSQLDKKDKDTFHHKEELEHKEAVKNRIIDEVYPEDED